LDRRRFRRLARGRSVTTWEEFEHELMEAGVSGSTACFIVDQLKSYYIGGLTPYPTDRVYSTLRIDPGDIEDVIEDYWRFRAWELPPLSDPQLCPDDPSLVEFALWLESHGQAAPR
jgi:hypothetical protein